ncbi:MAG: hypothetical protein JNJ70_01985 [Verrucomicrobiales bacterium]|nr:hypothetical protein [Verrucomicrobiales bacterium]
MQALYNMLYEPGLPLKLMGILVGLWLVASHVFALLKPGLVQPWLQAFPRNEKIGIALVIIGFAWAYVIWSCMDLGEFFKIERPVQMVIIGVCVGVIVYVKEFIAVRSLGFLMILAAAPMLESAFLKEPQSRLLLVVFAYVIAVKGMFWVGMPYLMRDQITWVLAKENRYKIGAIAGAAYGLVMAVCAVLWW